MNTLSGRLTPHPLPLHGLVVAHHPDNCLLQHHSFRPFDSNTVFLHPSRIGRPISNFATRRRIRTSRLARSKASSPRRATISRRIQSSNYWIQAKVVYCHKAAEGVTPESVAKANFGGGISSGGTIMVSANLMGGDQTGRGMPLGGMPGMGAMPMGGGMPDMNVLMAQAMAMSGGRGGFPGMQMQQAPKEDGVTYLCVTDVQITDRKMGKPLGHPTTGQVTTGPRVQQLRMVGHVRQKI